MRDDLFLTAREVADWLKISQASVPRLPLPRFRIGQRAVRYHKMDVCAYLAQRREAPQRAERPAPPPQPTKSPQAKPTDEWAKRLVDLVH